MLEQHPHNIHINRHVSQYYYIQKSTELQLLKEQLTRACSANWRIRQAGQALERVSVLQGSMEENYKELFNAWRRDARWLNKYLARSKSVL